MAVRSAHSPIPLVESAHGVTFAVRVVPRASRTLVSGVREDALLVRLSAPPVDGAANDALVEFLADIFDRPRRDVTIVSGQSARDKRVAIARLSLESIASRLSAILAER